MVGFTSRSIALWLLVVIQSASKPSPINQLLLFGIFIILVAWINAATISYVTTIIGGTRPQQNGSTEGGTLLWVYGTGFAPNEFSLVPSRETSNTVQLVRGNSSYDCGMQIEKGSDTQLACYTPPVPSGEYQVRVSVQGTLVPLSQYSSLSSATFIATSSNTPQIVSISPASGLPQRLVSLSGNFKTRCYLRDMIGCSEANVSVISR